MWSRVAGYVLGSALLGSVLVISVISGMSTDGLGSAFASESGDSPPVGHYGCYTAPVMTAVGPGYGGSIFRNRQREGDLWINSDRDYAGPNDKADMGTYVMDGRTLVAKTGAFGPPGPRTRVTYTPARGSNPASLYIVYFDNTDKPTRGTECVWSDALQ